MSLLSQCLPSAGAGACHRDGLPVWVSQRGRVALFIGVQVKVRQVEFVWVGLQSANGGLDEVHVLLLQGNITGFTAIAAVGDHGFHAGALFQVGQGFGQQLGIVYVVGRHLDFCDKLQFIFRVAGFGEVGNVAFVMACAFGAVAGFEVIH